MKSTVNVPIPLQQKMQALLNSPSAKLVQVMVTLTLLGWIVASLDRRVWDVLSGLRWAPLTLAVVLFGFAQVVGGLRLAMLLPGPPRFVVCIVATWIGYFWSSFLPSTVGGDLVRLFRLRQAGISLGTGAGALVADRLFNLLALVMLLCVSGTSLVAVIVDGREFLFDIGVAVVIVTVVFAGILFRYLASRSSMIAAANEVFGILVRRPDRLAAVFVLSFLNLGLAIVAQWIIAKSLGLRLSLSEMTSIACIITLVVMVPVSINGLGLQEVGYLMLLSSIGIPLDLGVAFAVLVRGMLVTVGIFSGIVVLLSGVRGTLDSSVVKRDDSNT